jgi:hypothetical protein
MVIQSSPEMPREIDWESNRGRHFILWRGSTIGDAFRFNGFQRTRKNARNCSGEHGNFEGTMQRGMNWVGLRDGFEAGAQAVKEQTHAKQNTRHCSDRRRHQRADRSTRAERRGACT